MSTHRRPPRQHHGRKILVFLAIALALSATACDSQATGADTTLNQLRGMNLVDTPPSHGSMLGRGEDRGSNSSVTGRPAGLTTVYVTPVPARAVEAYYQSTYPEYHLSEDCCATAQQADLVGRSSATIVGISITTGHPKIDSHFKIKLSAPPTGANTYVTIYLSGKTS